MYQAAWLSRYILDGYAIADEYSMTARSGELIVLGMNFRAYCAVRQTWNIKWLDGLTGTWLDLGPRELGGVKFNERPAIYAFKEPVAAHVCTPRLTRAFPRSNSSGEARSPMTASFGANSWSSKPIVIRGRSG